MLSLGLNSTDKHVFVPDNYESAFWTVKHSYFLIKLTMQEVVAEAILWVIRESVLNLNVNRHEVEVLYINSKVMCYFLLCYEEIDNKQRIHHTVLVPAESEIKSVSAEDKHREVYHICLCYVL